MNTLKTGLDAESEIIDGWESRGDRDALTPAAWYARFTPADEEECYLLDNAIASEWLQRRYLRVEANLWKQELDSTQFKSLGGAFHRASQAFTRVDRRLNSAIRNHASAMKQLHAIRAKRNTQPIGDITQPEVAAAKLLTPETPPEPSPTPQIDVATEPLNHKLVSFRTFQNSAPPLPDPLAPTPPPPGNIQPDPALSDII
jgi:hypothetical protein